MIITIGQMKYFPIQKSLVRLGARLLSLFATLATVHAVEPTRPNVVVMIADDLGAGDVSCLFRDVVKTPNIDRLAAMGVTFTSGYVTAPLCAPSRCGFFTGRHPHRFGFVANNDGIPVDAPLLPGVLHDAGYRTSLIGKWHSAGPMPHERGCFDETLCSIKSSPFIDYHHPRLARNGKIETFDVYSTDLFADEALGFIERNKSQPFALTVTFNAPHILNVVEDNGSIRRKYEAAVAAGTVFDIPKTPTARPGDAEKYLAPFPATKPAPIPWPPSSRWIRPSAASSTSCKRRGLVGGPWFSFSRITEATPKTAARTCRSAIINGRFTKGESTCRSLRLIQASFQPG